METIHIPRRPPNQRAWVVRASGGVFLNHFVQADMAAIGHIDGFRRVRADTRVVKIDRDGLYKWLLAKEGSSKARAASHSGQVGRFISEMKEGDLIVSVDAKNLVAGIVSGPALLSPHPVAHE